MTGTPPSGTGARTPIVRRAVAGEGKTHWLVGHFLTLVLDGGVSPAGIAVITFTRRPDANCSTASAPRWMR